MKILVVGASGTIGQAIVNELSPRHEIVKVGKTSGDFQVDITRIDSVKQLFERVGKVDAIISAAGNLHFGPLAEMTPELYNIGLQDKLMGQVNLALVGQHYLNDGGSITLTGGILAEQPVRFGSGASMVNSALEGFVLGAAIELPRGIRINVVSPNVLQESMGAYGPYFRGFEAVPVARVALAYSRSVEGAQTGQVYRVF
ncbi:short chain dehydrogenase [Chitinivorax sp. B]|uniref:short chain dehydrogenase n=1 Tax=Chitinivorax sp. B TaxID=2502235 RepID=UPI0010F47327|nr:short chain dehydrogenase [Chitinivorax sp. B]